MMMLNALAFPPLLTVRAEHVDHVRQATMLVVQTYLQPNAFHLHLISVQVALSMQIVPVLLLLLTVRVEHAGLARQAIIAAVQRLLWPNVHWLLRTNALLVWLMQIALISLQLLIAKEANVFIAKQVIVQAVLGSFAKEGMHVWPASQVTMPAVQHQQPQNVILHCILVPLVILMLSALALVLRHIVEEEVVCCAEQVIIVAALI